MKYLSLDIETTGLDKNNCQVLQIAAVVDDLSDLRSIATKTEDLPSFKAFIHWDNINFEPYALNLHAKTGFLTRYLEDKYKKRFDDVISDFEQFLIKHYPLASNESRNFAGKNLQGFDLPFLFANRARRDTRDSRWPIIVDGVYSPKEDSSFLNRIRHRVIDPSVFFTDFFSDKATASLDQCKQRAGLEGEVSHDALDDARDVVNLVRHIAVHNKGIFNG